MQVNQLRWLRIELQQWVLAFCLLMSCMAIAVKAQTSLVSINQSGTGTGNRHSHIKADISADGRWVVFMSTSSDLVSGDSNGDRDIFVRDLATGTTKLVSINNAGTGSGNGGSDWSSITPDGRYVVFMSRADNLVPGDTNGKQDVFIRDLITETTRLVSVNNAGTGPGNGESVWPQITPDGRYVVFISYAADLVSGISDTNGVEDIFVRDLVTGTTRLVSINSSGMASGKIDIAPSITPDGRHVVFMSWATDLVSGISDTSDKWDVFVRDLVAGITTLISVNTGGTASGNNNSYAGSRDGSRPITADGRYIVFTSAASDLIFGDTNGKDDVFVRDLMLGITKPVSVNYSGTTNGNDYSGWASIIPDGRYIVFKSAASDLIPGDTNGKPDIFVRNLASGITTLVTATPTGTVSTKWPYSSVPGDLSLPQITADGRYVVFLSPATDLVSGINDTNESVDLFARDLVAGRTTLISVNSGGAAAGNSASAEPVITPDGRHIVFASSATDLVSGIGDTNGGNDFFIAGPCPTTVIPSSISVGIVGVSYRQSFVGVGGRGNLTFQLTGSLPAGLSFTSDGVLSGIPTAAGSFFFTVSVAHETGCSASRSYTLIIETCSYKLSPVGSTIFSRNPGGGSINVMANVNGCSWAARSTVSWISVTGNGTGNGRIGYSVAYNATGKTRTGKIMVGSSSVLITQSGVGPIGCLMPGLCPR